MSIPGTRVGSQVINNVACEIYASADGRFRVGHDGEEYGYGETLSAAIDKARAKINKGKTKVRVEFFSRATGEAGIATGVHAGNGSILVEYQVEGRVVKDTLRSHESEFKPDTPKGVIETYFANRQVISDRQDDNKAIEREWTQQIGARVNEAIAAAQEAAKAEPEQEPVARPTAKRVPFHIKRK